MGEEIRYSVAVFERKLFLVGETKFLFFHFDSRIKWIVEKKFSKLNSMEQKKQSYDNPFELIHSI